MSKFAIQARGSKRQNVAQKQKNMAQNLFSNECKALIYFVEVKTKIKLRLQKIVIESYGNHIFTKQILFNHSLQKHMVRKHYYSFRYLAKMLKKRSRGFDRAQCYSVINFIKQIANSFANITNGQRFLDVVRGELPNV